MTLENHHDFSLRQGRFHWVQWRKHPLAIQPGGKQKLGRISKMGRNLRKLLGVVAHAVLFHGKSHTDPLPALRTFPRRTL
jgi:hypothetical protein